MYQEFCQNGEAQQVHCVESVFAEAHIDYVWYDGERIQDADLLWPFSRHDYLL